MTEPAPYRTVIVWAGGKQRRLVTAKQLRSAIFNQDITRDTAIRVESETGDIAALRAGDSAELAPLFEEILGPEAPRPPSPVSEPTAPDDAPQSDGASAAMAAITAMDATTVSPPVVPVRAVPVSAPAPLKAAGSTGEFKPINYHRDAPPGIRPLAALAALAVALIGVVAVYLFLAPRSSPSDSATESAELAAAADQGLDAGDVPAKQPKPSPSAKAEAESEKSAAKMAKKPPKSLTPSPVIAEQIAEPEPIVSRARKVSPLDRGSWARRIAGDYPERAMENGEQGSVGISVTIGGDGQVQACSVTASSGSRLLDAAACRGMIRYARFAAALDDAGQPIASTWSTSIVYRLQ